MEEVKKQVPKYVYPDEVLTAADMQRMARFGVRYVLRKEDCERVSFLDSQKKEGKSIFGSGFILSEKAAAEKAAAEKVDVHVWELSYREKEIVKRLGGGRHDD